MANRRMFAKTITNSDLFLEMPLTSQLLYFHLGMNADDDGFVQLRSVMRSLGSTEDDAKVLFAKEFLLRFQDGVVVITDWLINNEIRRDRYKETFYLKHRTDLETLPNGRYQLNETLVLPNDNHLDTQVRLGKVRLGKVNTNGELSNDNYAQFVDFFNSVTGRRFGYTDKKARKQYEYLVKQQVTKEQFELAIRNAYSDPFHAKNGFAYLTPEFLTRPDKFEKFLNVSVAQMNRPNITVI